MADRALVEHLVSEGMARDDAEHAVDTVFAGTLAVLLAGKSVGIPNVCRLTAPRKPAWLPGSVKRQAVEQRKVALRNAAVIERGEPYAA